MDTAGELRRLLATSDPVLLVIAGPNGAGKTTFFETSLERQLRIPFVKADRIARTLPTGGGADAKDEVALWLAAELPGCFEAVTKGNVRRFKPRD